MDTLLIIIRNTFYLGFCDWIKERITNESSDFSWRLWNQD